MLEDLLRAGTVEPVGVARIGRELGRAFAEAHATGRPAPDADDVRFVAPEVVRGVPASEQADVYRLGVLLYHLLAGAFPVSAEGARQGRHLEEWNSRADLRGLDSGVPSALACVIERAIDPRPEVRYTTIDALCADLHSAERELRAAVAPIHRWLQYGAALVGVVVVAALVWMVALSPFDRQILVVQFEHTGEASDAKTIVDGITIETTRLLARVKGLNLHAAIPSTAYLHRPRDAVAFGAQRRASHVLSGTVHGDVGAWHLIEASLVRVRDGRTMWSESFSVEDNNLLAVQERIARAISQELKLRFDPGPRRYSTTPALQEEFMRARAIQARPDATRSSAAAVFERVASEDPSFVPAVAALAVTLGGVTADGADLPVLDPMMALMTRRAYGEDPGLAEANGAMGLLSARMCEWTQAKAYFTEALRLDRTLTSTHIDYAISTLLALGQGRQAVGVLRAALASDPASVAVRRALAHVLVENGEYSLAIETSRELIEETPDVGFARQALGRALYLSGHVKQAIETFSGDAHWGYRGYVFAIRGRQVEARRLAESHPGEPARQMLIYAGLNDRDRAFDALQRAAQLNPWRALTWMQRAEIEPVFRSDPRVRALREQLLRPAASGGCAVESRVR
jgi:TolB-like protein